MLYFQLFMEQNDIWGEKNMIGSIENKELVILDIGYLRLTGIGLLCGRIRRICRFYPIISLHF